MTLSLSCSVIVPCRNEVGNVADLVRRLPALGTHTELIFVDGGSTDGTQAAIREQIARHPGRDIRLIEQVNSRGKAEAVFVGFDAARGDVLIILDADMTVPPETLPRFYDVLAGGGADFVNGTRFVFSMERGAMPTANQLGNRAFNALMTWLVGRPISDTLCGTKALFRRDWPRIRAVRPRFGFHDPWGDFDLLLGAALLGLRIVEIPVAYRRRVAGESKMRPWGSGVALLQTCVAGARALKLGRQT